MSTTSTTSKGKGHSLLLIFLGLAVLAFWIMASLVQIQTTEAYLLAKSGVNYIPNWNVLQQPMQLAEGNISSAMAMAIMGGWGVELVFLICVIGYEVCVSAVHTANHKLTKLFVCGMILIVIFDLYTDYLYGHIGSGIYGQIAFAIIMGIIVTFFGLAGVAMIEHGVRNWGK